MLNPNSSRLWHGIYIEGQQIGLRVMPSTRGTLSVDVIARPALTGFHDDCRLGQEEQLEFVPSEITVHDTRLECLAADRFAPFLRTGFMLDLEPGMAAQLRAWLPRLILAAATSKTLADLFSESLATPIFHMHAAIVDVVTRIVLADWDAEHSISFERERGTWRNEQQFMSQFNDPRVIQELQGLVELRAQQPAGPTDLPPVPTYAVGERPPYSRYAIGSHLVPAPTWRIGERPPYARWAIGQEPPMRNPGPYQPAEGQHE